MVSEDREYVERVLCGETDAFEHLVRKYNRLGGAVAYGVLGDFQLAEDVVQDAFLKAFRALRSLRDPQRFRVWFAGIVKKRAIDVLRQQKAPALRAVSLDTGEAEREEGGRELEGAGGLASDARRPQDSGTEPLIDSFVRAEQRRKILECIAELPEADRMVVVLKHMEGLSYREIAELTASSVSAVESRLFRARRALRRKLSQLLKLDSER